MRPNVRVRWWLGWHPLYTVGAAAVLGFLVGNVVVTWAARAAMLRGGVGGYVEPLHRITGGGTAFLLVLAALPVVLSILVGVVLGVLTWLVGVWTVNRRAADVRADLLDEAHEGAFEYVTASGTVPLVSSPRTHSTAAFDIGPAEMTIHTRRVSMPERTVTLDRVDVVEYDDLRTVTVDPDGSITRFETDDGAIGTYTSGRPAALLAELQTRRPDLTVEE